MYSVYCTFYSVHVTMYSVLFLKRVSCSIPSCSIPSCSIPSCSIPSCSIPSCSVSCSTPVKVKKGFSNHYFPFYLFPLSPFLSLSLSLSSLSLFPSFTLPFLCIPQTTEDPFLNFLLLSRGTQIRSTQVKPQ